MPETSAAHSPALDSGEVEVLRERVRELETQLAQAQKLGVMNSLASGLAHDFNNLLTAILGYASLLREEGIDPSSVREGLDIIEKAAERASQVTTQLLRFARRGEPKLDRVDLHGTLRELAALLHRTVDKSIAIEMNLDAPDAEVMADPGQMFQVFLNLALNARDAMPNGGSIRFTTSNHAGRIRVRVADTGCGIPKQLQDRVFEPFFTTKDGKGTGMGLTVVLSIVRAHGGSIEMESAGMGAIFDVLLPLAPPRERVRGVQSDHRLSRGRGAVLVVDDEEIVCNVASRMLRTLGFDAICLGSAAEALDYFRQHWREIDLVIVDLMLPQVDGRHCFHQIRDVRPDARVVLSSGYGPDSMVETLLGSGAKSFLQKPYRLGQLSKVLAEAMK